MNVIYQDNLTTIVYGDGLRVVDDYTIREDADIACIFADPPDNIGLAYDSHADQMSEAEYVAWLERCLLLFTAESPVTWLSFNTRWITHVGSIYRQFLADCIELKPCVQVFTFGQHNNHDLGNNHRPLWRFAVSGKTWDTDAIRVESWRLANGDPRAYPAGRVPGDVFEFPRVVGNSKQRRSWHPTQLHEGLVERCLLMSTRPGDLVVDPFMGTGTTARVCRRIGRRCVTADVSLDYCQRVAAEFKASAEAPV